MTNKLAIRLFALLLTIVAGASLSSCDEDDPYFSDIVGSWHLVESDGQPVYDYQTDYYSFYSNGSGTYAYYDTFGHFWQETFSWQSFNGEQLVLYYDNPNFGTVSCYYRYDGRYMYFSTDRSFYSYTVYSR